MKPLIKIILVKIPKNIKMNPFSDTNINQKQDEFLSLSQSSVNNNVVQTKS